MRITMETDYAVRIIYTLSLHKDKRNAAQIAEEANVPTRFAIKILRKLLLAELVKSYKGAEGGYMLNRKPSEITLKDVFAVINGEVEINRCIDIEPCLRMPNCPFHPIFLTLNERISSELSKITFENIKNP